MIDKPLPLPLDDFLNNPPARPEPAELRRLVLGQTVPHLGRRRRWMVIRSYLWTAAIITPLLLYALICSSAVELVRRLAERADEEAFAQNHGVLPIVEEPQPAPAPPLKEKPPPVVAKAPLPAVALEWKAFDAPGVQQSALYLQAGDRYVEDKHDLASALRCYVQSVQAAPVETLEIDPNDNWLVMALKMDQIERRKEK